MSNVEMLRVKAGKHGPVHREGGVREVDANGRDLLTITDQPVEVPNTRYYRRRLAMGDLVTVEED